MAFYFSHAPIRRQPENHIAFISKIDKIIINCILNQKKMDFSIDLLHLTFEQAQPHICNVAGVQVSKLVGIFFNCCFNRQRFILFQLNFQSIITLEYTTLFVQTLYYRVDKYYVATNLTNLLLNIECLVRVAQLPPLPNTKKYKGFK